MFFYPLDRPNARTPLKKIIQYLPILLNIPNIRTVVLQLLFPPSAVDLALSSADLHSHSALNTIS